MQAIYPYLLQTHQVMGVFALVAYWIVLVLSRKGSPFHVHMGWIYVYCMIASVGAALILAGGTVIDPEWRVTVNGPPRVALDIAMRAARGVRLWFFIGGLLAVACGIQGILASKHRKSVGPIRAPWLVVLHASVIPVTLAGVGYYIVWPGLYLIGAFLFAPFAIGMSVSNIRYLYRNQRGPRDWIYAHLTCMLTSGLIGHLALFISRGPKWFGFAWGGAATTALALSPLYIGVPAMLWYIRRDRRRRSPAPPPPVEVVPATAVADRID